MMRRFFCAGVALLLAVGVTLAAEKKAANEAGQGKAVLGKVVSLEIKGDGTGTLTVLARKARGEQPSEMTFKVTKETKFVKGAGRNSEGTAVEAAHVSDTFKKDATVGVRYEGEGSNLTATRVNAATPRPRPNQ